jgi:cell division protein FtsI/penicillin-binding protein 2
VRHVLVEAGGVVIQKTGVLDLAIDDVGLFAATLSDLLEGKPSSMELREMILKRRRDGAFSRSGALQIVVRKGIDDPRIVARLDDARTRLPGLIVRHADRRDYPNGSWGGHLLGVARSRDAYEAPRGLDGLEAGLDQFLCGSTVKVTVPVDGRGRRFVTPRSIDAREDADGRTAWLALDLVVQSFCEQALDDLVRAWPVTGAVAIVMDPATGDVLGMAQRPGFDPSAAEDVAGQNLATQWQAEVGSTFKPVTVARALDLGLVGPQERFELPRSREFTVGRSSTTVRDAHEGETTGPGTVVEVIAHSNNPDTADCAWRIGSEGMKRLLKDVEVEDRLPLLGLKDREGVGYVRWDRVGATDHLRWGFGHGFTMTPMRLASVFCAFARDDFRPVVPRLVLAVGGEVVPDLPLGPCLVRDPAKQAVIRRALRAVVTDGTGKRAVESPKFSIAGKTGTAKKPVGEGAYYSCSFVGYAPAERPRLLCLVMAQEPRAKADGSKPYGGAVAGPAVRYILEKSLQDYLGATPNDEPPASASTGPATVSTPTPDAPPTSPAAASVTPFAAREDR